MRALSPAGRPAGRPAVSPAVSPAGRRAGPAALPAPRDPLQDWSSRSSCRTTDPDVLFVTGAAQNRAKAVCMGCPVRAECLADALDNRVEFGVWGGMTERERRALLRRRPDVESWSRLFEQARAEHAAG